MGNALEFKLMGNFLGVNTEIPAVILLDTDLYNSDYGTIIDREMTYHEGDPIITAEQAIGVIRGEIGFNPFQFVKVKGTNAAGFNDQLPDVLIEKLNEVSAGFDYLQSPNGDTRFTSVRIGDYILSTSSPAEYFTQIPGFCDKYTQNFTDPMGNEIIGTVRYDALTHLIPTAIYLTSYIPIAPDEYFTGDDYDPDVLTSAKALHIVLGFSPTLHGWTCTQIHIDITELYDYLVLLRTIATVKPTDVNYLDPADPYNTVPISTLGGGTGAGSGAGIDDIDGAEVPQLPNISPAAGFMTIYRPSVSQIKALSDFMWSSAFDLDNFKKLFADPMDCIIGLGIVPVTPISAGTKNVIFGDIDTGVSMPYISNQFVEVSCGSVNIKEYIGCFMDYAPYTKISIYLPYIGFRDLSPDDVMGESLSVTYHIDVLTGGLTCYLHTSNRGVLYQFSGNCILNVPLTSNNYSSAIQNAISAVCSGAGIVAGAATGNAPIAAMSVASLASTAANTAINSKPTIERSGSMSASSGIMGIQKPYIVINRPRMSIPENLSKFAGHTLNVTCKLGNCRGFTKISEIHLDNVPCTDTERDELYRILKEGIIL